MTDIYSRKNRIKEALEIRGLKQVDLVEKAGVPKSALCSWIHQRWQPKQTALFNMAKVLNVSEMWLAGYDVPMEKSTLSNPKERIARYDYELNNTKKDSYYRRDMKKNINSHDHISKYYQILNDNSVNNDSDINIELSENQLLARKNLDSKQLKDRAELCTKILELTDDQVNSLASIVNQYLKINEKLEV